MHIHIQVCVCLSVSSQIAFIYIYTHGENIFSGFRLSLYTYTYIRIVEYFSGAYFKFESPDIRDHILTAHEHSTVQIVFHLEKLKCQNISSSIILIEKFFNNSYVFICRIRHVNDECTPSGRTGVACQCVSTNGTYSLTKTVERLDSTHWRWKWVTSEEKENITYITFNILCKFTFSLLKL